MIYTFDPTTLAATNQSFFTSAIPSSIAFSGGSISVVAGGQLIQYGTNGAVQVTSPFTPFGSVNAQDSNALLASLSGAATSGHNAIVSLVDFTNTGLGYNLLGDTTILASAVAISGSNAYALAGNQIDEFSSNQNLAGSYSQSALITFGSLSEGNSNIYISFCQINFTCQIDILTQVTTNGFSTDVLATTSSLATDILFANNSIYATFADGTISRYDANGNLEASAAHPGEIFTSLAYGNGELFASTEAPEPLSGGLLALGAMSLVLYKRRAK